MRNVWAIEEPSAASSRVIIVRPDQWARRSTASADSDRSEADRAWNPVAGAVTPQIPVSGVAPPASEVTVLGPASDVAQDHVRSGIAVAQHAVVERLFG